MNPIDSGASNSKRLLRRVRRIAWRCCKVCLWLVAGFLGLCLAGMIPVNNDFRNDPDGIEVVIVSSAVHSDIVLPVNAAGIDWRTRFPAGCFQGDVNGATHVAIGWGDKGFFIETPTWNEFRIRTAANALLWPSATCVHVVMADSNWAGREGVRVRLSGQQYRALAEEVGRTFMCDDTGCYTRIPDARYDWNDAFFAANGRYHLLNTCNSWVGRVMKKGGIRVGWFTPLPKTVYFWLPE